MINTGDQDEDEAGDVNDNWEVAVTWEASGRSPRAKNRAEANLVAECLVCGGRAAAHYHYGAVCCYSCR